MIPGSRDALTRGLLTPSPDAGRGRAAKKAKGVGFSRHHLVLGGEIKPGGGGKSCSRDVASMGRTWESIII